MRIRDMKWFQCIDLSCPLMLDAVEAIGQHGAFQCMMVTAEALAQQVKTLDVKMVSNWANVKRDRAEKIMPFAQKILTESLKISTESIQNVSKISKNLPKISEDLSEISENLVDFDASNPDGSTRAHDAGADNIFINNINNKKINKKSYDAEFSVWYDNYPKKEARGRAEKAYAAARNEVTAEELLDGVRRYILNKPDYAAWQQPAAWLNGKRWLDEYPSKPENNVTPINAKSDFEKLCEFPFIGDSATGEWFTPDQLVPDVEIGNAYRDPNGGLHYIGGLKGSMEEPSHARA